MGILAKLLMKIAPALSIHVARGAFVFKSAHESLTLPTILYCEPTAAGPRVLSVGEAPQGTETGTRVDSV